MTPYAPTLTSPASRFARPPLLPPPPAPSTPPAPPAPPGPSPLTGRTLDVLGVAVTVLLAQEDTRGQLSIVRLDALPGSGVPAHRHERESETFYVLEGAVEVEICGTRRRLEAGQAAYLPAGVPHAWFVPGDGPAQALVLSTPGGLERMFEDIDWLAQRGVSEPAALAPILARYGLTFHQPETPPSAGDEDVRTD